jgi:hypothetical protein
LEDKPRLALFNEFEKAILKPLPSSRLDVTMRVSAKVARDYVVWMGEDQHFYSVPFENVGKQATIMYNSTTVEVYVDNTRVAIHQRKNRRGRTMVLAHMPPNHYEYSKQSGWTPDFFCNWARSISPDTLLVIEKMITSNIVKQQGFRACMGTLVLAKKYSKERLARACSMAVYAGVYRLRFIRNILKNNMDKKDSVQLPSTQAIMDFHENNRNPAEYQ